VLHANNAERVTENTILLTYEEDNTHEKVQQYL
jgi:hypothetical protein